MRDKLLKILKKEALFKEKIKLSSGKISNFYIDVRRVSLSSRGIYLISQIIWDMIKKDNPTAIGGPTLGADPIVAGVCFLANQKGKNLKGFIVRKEPKKYGRQNLIEGKELSKEDRIILVDDVATTGSSLINAISVLYKYKLKVLKAIVVVDREEGAKESLEKLKCPLYHIFTKRDFLED
ncbi:MAG: orotate phosphoribosyltransferase [Candidatus Omnitrophica bacterium]|nr:orotate phosphoribosyltransferase [Candidatus Omnitrophota bacterium]